MSRVSVVLRNRSLIIGRGKISGEGGIEKKIKQGGGGIPKLLGLMRGGGMAWKNKLVFKSFFSSDYPYQRHKHFN